jgi:hypothetical protein
MIYDSYDKSKLAQWLAFLMCWCAMFAVVPAAQAADKKAGQATQVEAGIFLNSIRSVQLKERKFQADFNVWFRWSGDAVNPLESFEVVDGQVDSKEVLAKKKIGEMNYGLYRIVATIHANFDLSKYPLDDHGLQIQIEDSKLDLGDMVYRADSANSSVSPGVHVPGWDVSRFAVTTITTRYPTNYGDTSGAHGSNAKESSYSRLSLTVDLRRNGYGNFFKLFSMLFFAGILSFFAFRVRPDYLDSRLALIVSGIFMAAITANMISATLPESDAFDMAEKLYFATMGFIFATCLASLYTFKLYMGTQEARANALSRALGFAMPIAYVVVNVLIVVLAHGEI